MVVNRSAPRATVVPILVYEDVAAAIDWLCDAFGFTERLRAAGPGGVVSHAQLVIGEGAEGALMLGRPGGEFRPPRPGEVSQTSSCTSRTSRSTSSTPASAARGS